MRKIRGRRDNSQYHSLQSPLVSTRSLFLTGEGISREVRLELRLLIDLFIVVISTLLEPTLFFNLVPVDQETASLTGRMVVSPATQEVKSLLEATTIECKCLTRQASSCSNADQMEMEMDSFLTLAVSLLTRETTKLWFLTVPIIAYKYLMRRAHLFVPSDHQGVVMVSYTVLLAL